MTTYLRFTNGSTTLLINYLDTVRQDKAVEDGFYLVEDEDGSPATGTSDELLVRDDNNKAAIIRAVQDKIKSRSSTLKKANTLAARSNLV